MNQTTAENNNCKKSIPVDAENEKREQADLSREEIKFLQPFILVAPADWKFQCNSILSVFRKTY